MTALTATPPENITLVVGGTGGLGSAICRRLAGAGHDLLFTYRTNRTAAKKLSRDIEASGVHGAHTALDLGDLKEIRHVLAEAGALGTINTLVYAAGPDIPQRYFSSVSPDDWGKFAIGELNGFFNLIHAALPVLRRSQQSRIVATTSCATTRVIPGDVLSAVPKAGIEMLIRQVAREEGRYGIRANCVAPGIIDAGLGLKAQQDYYTPDVWEAQRKSIPSRSFGSAEAIADTVLFLVNDDSHYITGQTIVVDGGLSV